MQGMDGSDALEGLTGLLAGEFRRCCAPLWEKGRLFDALNALAMLDEARDDTTLTELALERARELARGRSGAVMERRERDDAGAGGAGAAEKGAMAATTATAATAAAAAPAAAPEGARRGGAMTLREFFGRFRDHYRAEQTATRAKARQLEIAMCRALGPGMPVTAVGAEDLGRALGAYRCARSYNGMRTALVTAARWGAAEGLCDWREFMPAIRRRPEQWREPAFFLPAAVERILRLAEEHPGPAGGAVGMRLALGFLAGVRTVEIERARWRDIDLGSRTVRIPRPKGWTRGMKPRIVELEPNATAWLRKWAAVYRGGGGGGEEECGGGGGGGVETRRGGGGEAECGGGGGDLIVKDRKEFARWKKRWLEPEGLSWGAGRRAGGGAAKRGAGGGAGAGGARGAENERGGNLMRHTYATMHVAAFRDAAATALNLGHGRGTEMLERHYRGLVPRKTAEAYWRIWPSDVGAGGPPAESAGAGR